MTSYIFQLSNRMKYLFFFLVFCVASNTHFLIFNEETLVVFSFASFLTFVSHYYGTMIHTVFFERSQSIQTELENFLVVKQQYLNQLLYTSTKILELRNTLSLFATYLTQKLQSTEFSLKEAVKKCYSFQLVERFSTLSQLKTRSLQKTKDFLSLGFFTICIARFYKRRKFKRGRKFDHLKTLKRLSRKKTIYYII